MMLVQEIGGAGGGLSSESVTLVVTGLLTLGLALTHLFSGRVRFLDMTPRSLWLSIAGGVSVAYVFVHIFPELSEWQELLVRGEEASEGFRVYLAYILALAGLALFYGLEQAALTSRRANARAMNASPEAATSNTIFWLHIVSFGIYNALIGYLLLKREETSLHRMLLFSVAMALHFVVNDHGLREHHKAIYDRIGRWLLAAAVIFGWVVSLVAELPPAWLSGASAFIAGGIVLNVLKEELPDERESRFWAFALGAASYTIVLILAG